MIRIVGVQKGETAAQEFVLLQNQGAMRETLRGRALVSADALHGNHTAIHLFTDDVRIGPGQFVLIRTCAGEPRWGTSKDGAHVYFTFAGRELPMWQCESLELHLLSPSHLYAERREASLLV